jgi:hypothetical protein
MNLINKALMSHSIGAKELFLVILSMISIGCGSDSSSNSKRNARNLYNLEIYAPQCRIDIKKSFSTQADLCQYISYELSNSSCAYNELQREYRYNNCHNPIGSNINQGQIIGGQVGGQINGQWDGQVTVGNGTVPTNPVIDDSIEFDLNLSYQSILNYYTIDSTNCFIKIIGTGVVLNDCVDSVVPSDEKDQTYRPGPVAEKDQTYTPEKDQDYSPNAGRPTPAKDSPKGATKDSTVVTPAKPAQTPASSKLDYNLVYFNTRSLHYEELAATRRPVLKITGRVDQNSPIYDLRHEAPSEIKDIKLIDLQSTCPLKSQLSTSSNTMVLTLLSAAESTSDQVEACRVLFDTISNLSSLEFSYDKPIKMTNGKSFNAPFKLINQ